MNARRRVRARRHPPWAGVLLLAVAAGCSGSGSDIGPDLEPDPEVLYRVLLRDDAGRGIANAVVRVDGVQGVGISSGNGRATFFEPFGGQRVLRVDAAHASATGGDMLADIAIRRDDFGLGELPFVLTLADLAPSAGLVLTAGTQASTAVLDDSASSGAIVTVPAGSAVGPAAPGELTLRTGTVSRQNLPPGIPAGSGAAFVSAGAVIGPAAFTCSPGAALSVPNDLGLAAGQQATLHRLDPATGVWTAAGTGTVNGSATRIEAPAGSVTTGGLHCFAVAVGPSVTLSGRVVDIAKQPLNDVLVMAPNATAVTGSDGRFSLTLPGRDAGGAGWTVPLTLTGGRGLLPVRRVVDVEIDGGPVDAGDLELATRTVADIRTLRILRGRTSPGRRVRLGAGEGLTTGIAVGDASGRALIEDIETGRIGFLDSTIRTEQFIDVSQGVITVPDDVRLFDLRTFGVEAEWWQGAGNGTTVNVVDRVGTGPVQFAKILSRGNVETETSISGVATVDFGIAGRATAAIVTFGEGVTVNSAFTVVDPDSGRLEMPIERATRSPTGNFVAHGQVSGELTGSLGAGRDRRVRATRMLVEQDLVEAGFLDIERTLADRVPVKEDPADGGTAYRIGVPMPQGNVAAVEGTTSGGVFTLERLGFAARLDPPAGGRQVRDIALEHAATTTYLIGDLFKLLDARLSATDLVVDLAARLADGTLVDVARGIGGNHVRVADDLTLALPPLQGGLADGAWLVTVRGATTAGGLTVDQRTRVALASTAPVTRQLHGLPEITSPAPGTTVSRDGFTVTWTVPVTTYYVEVELRSVVADSIRSWRVLLPASRTSFEFRRFGSDVPEVLAPGRTWTVTVRAARIESGPLSRVDDAWRRIAQNFVGIDEAEREVNAVSSTSITVTTDTP